MSDYREGFAISPIKQSGDNKIDSLLYGYKYGTSTQSGVTLSYSFPWTTNSTALWEYNYGYGEPYARVHYGLSYSQRVAAVAALQSWSNVANVNFVEVQEAGNEVGDIRFGFSSTVADEGAWGWAYLPSSRYASDGDIWISTNLNAYNLDFSSGGYGFYALIHELGHILGLKHPGYYGSNDKSPFLPTTTDNRLYTVMSYNEPKNNLWYDTVARTWIDINDESPMVYDILAIQYIYGANKSYHTSNDVYTFDNEAPFRMTIWDAGGVDTISVASSTRGSLINLNEGAYSSIQTSRFYSQNGIRSTVDGSYNLGIAYKAIIENAIGGSGNDKLIGNNVANILDGGAGNDTISGGAGNDTLEGRLGNDTLNGGTGIDTVTYKNSTVGVTVNLALTSAQTIQGAEKDTLIGIENLTGSNYNDTLTGSNSANIISGGAGSDTIKGGDGNDILNGESGSDSIDGGNGTDTLTYANATTGITANLSSTIAQATGGSGSDTIRNIENLTGSNYNDTLTGSNSANIISGGAGSDIINGLAGNDILAGGNGNDIFVFNTSLNSTTNKDTITDFVSFVDMIYLENGIFTKLSTIGTLSNNYFKASAYGTASDANDYILYNTTTGTLSYDADGNGSRAAVVFATLGTSLHPTITNADFYVI